MDQIISAMGPVHTSGGAQGLAALVLEFRQDGIRRSPGDLAGLYVKSCREDWVPACDPGVWRTDGEPDLAKGAAAMRAPCEAGDAIACLIVGWGDAAMSATEAPDRGAGWFERACDLGLPRGCGEWGLALRGLDGGPREPRRAAELLDGACRAGVANACSMLSGLLHEGEAEAPDLPRALSAARRACELGDAVGCVTLLEGTVEPADSELGVRGLRESCAAGFGWSCNQLALGYDSGLGVAKDQGEATRLYVAGCELGDAKNASS